MTDSGFNDIGTFSDTGKASDRSGKWSRRTRFAVLGGLIISSWVPFGALGYACSCVIG